MTGNNLESHLETTFNTVSEWLRFAEAKNAGLVALNGITLSASVTYLSSETSNTVWTAGLSVGVVCFAISSLIALISFLPEVGLSRVLRQHHGRISPLFDNLLFFEHLKKYKPDELVQAVSEKYGLPLDRGSQQLCQDLAAQITANARIASRKNTLFTLGAWVTLIGAILVPIVAFIAWLTQVVTQHRL